MRKAESNRGERPGKYRNPSAVRIPGRRFRAARRSHQLISPVRCTATPQRRQMHAAMQIGGAGGGFSRGIFAETVLQFMEINTLYQLLADKTPATSFIKTRPRSDDGGSVSLDAHRANARSKRATRLTTQLLSRRRGTWFNEAARRVRLAGSWFAPHHARRHPNRPGPIHRAAITVWARVPVIAPATHDRLGRLCARRRVRTAKPDWFTSARGPGRLMGVKCPNRTSSNSARH